MIALELDPAAALVASGAVVAVLAGLHPLAPPVHTLPGVPRRAVGSFGGGLAVAYVFLHLLPELAEGSREVGEEVDDALVVTPLLELSVFAVGVYRLHVGSYAVYNALITYTMPLRFSTGVAFAVLFAVAMGLHLVLTDRGLAEHYPYRFRRRGRFVLAGALVAGWLLAAAPTSTLAVALLTALLGGAVLLNVVEEELPSVGGSSSYPWFLTGLVLYAVLLTAVTAFAG